jgi:hypothetical protein
MEPLEWRWVGNRFTGCHLLPYVWIYSEGVYAGWLCWEFGFERVAGNGDER